MPATTNSENSLVFIFKSLPFLKLEVHITHLDVSYNQIHYSKSTALFQLMNVILTDFSPVEGIGGTLSQQNKGK
jgi:hypothetical protein